MLLTVIGLMLLGGPPAEAADAAYGGLLDLPALNCEQDAEGRVVMDLPALNLVGGGRVPPTSNPIIQPTAGQATLQLEAIGTGDCMSATGTAWVFGDLKDPLGTVPYDGSGTFQLGPGMLSFTGSSPSLGADVFFRAWTDEEDGGGARPLTLAKLRFESLGAP